MDYLNRAPEPVPEDAGQTPAQRPRRRRYSEHWRPTWTVALLAAIIFVVEFGLTLSDIPSTSIVGNWLCVIRNDGSQVPPYPNSDSPPDCKVADIQQDLNTISTVSLAVASVARQSTSYFLTRNSYVLR